MVLCVLSIRLVLPLLRSSIINNESEGQTSDIFTLEASGLSGITLLCFFGLVQFSACAYEQVKRKKRKQKTIAGTSTSSPLHSKIRKHGA